MAVGDVALLAWVSSNGGTEVCLPSPTVVVVDISILNSYTLPDADGGLEVCMVSGSLCYHSILLLFCYLVSTLFQVKVALKEMFGWWEGEMSLREEWKSVLKGSGELCVVIHLLGHQTMPWLCASNCFPLI